MARREEELSRDIVDRSRVTMTHGIPRIEGFGHVQSVEPHLLRIDLLVPQSAFRRARMCSQLVAQTVRGA